MHQTTILNKEWEKLKQNFHHQTFFAYPNHTFSTSGKQAKQILFCNEIGEKKEKTNQIKLHNNNVHYFYIDGL